MNMRTTNWPILLIIAAAWFLAGVGVGIHWKMKAVVVIPVTLTDDRQPTEKSN